jgi:hypothetical protein
VSDIPTYAEALRSAYTLAGQAAQAEREAYEVRRDAEWRVIDAGMKLAREHDLEAYEKGAYIARVTQPDSDDQKDLVRKLMAADKAFQKAAAERKHWERVGAWRSDQLEAHPELAEQELMLVNEWRALVTKRGSAK